ncbi:2-oxoglutarate ferredoxin oxidoreductase, gamma subunit [Candidatus Koribacter versatilis Ellin345]|uniref:2-oxoglutarate ferredoxin oxidoreductase, gamma subunit n=1 Tax=Koribacter versatilis (strain Ellin345) TaxID=204669 RepID=Q1IQP1_KORVE|nr:2-oxoacid:acceptor oxidoreductase family protein [Candidatus Koribacter versatilis]ABF40809.1 2-oxoglutarate ferredoxin oxidoreductase, gamma subunit [Candidatus Koribacter versatilis Ellin345]
MQRLQLTEIRIAGFGGQGVILSAIVIGKAASILEGGFATMTQSFGPEARGGACSAQVVIDSKPVLYPYVTNPDILIVMSQEAYTKFGPELKPGGVLIVEQDLVKITGMSQAGRVYSAPATRLAEELGKRMILNIVMVGFTAAVTNILQKESLREAVASSVPPSFRELNLKAFDRGYEYGVQALQTTPETGVDENTVKVYDGV